MIARLIAGVVLMSLMLTCSTEGQPVSGPTVLDAKWVALFNSRQTTSEKLELLRAEMMLRNPMMGEMKTKIEGQKIVSIEFVNGHYVSDLKPLRVLRDDLERLRCCGHKGTTGRLADLTPLEGMKLKELHLRYQKIGDPALKVLAKMPLEILELSQNPISNASGLTELPLKELYLDGCEKLTTLPMFPKGAIVHLEAASTGLTKIDILKGHPLKYLNIHSTNVDSLAPLRGCKTLESLDCASSPVSDLSPLEGMPIRTLYCGDATDPRGVIASIQVLKDMPLEALAIHAGNYKSLNVLRGKKITILTLRNNPNITDLKALEGFPLKRLFIAGLKVANFGPLEAMSIVRLDASETSITDLKPLKLMSRDMDILSLRNTKITDLTPLTGGKVHSLTLTNCGSIQNPALLGEIQITSLAVQGVPIKDWTFLRQIKGLTHLTVDNANDPKLKEVLKSLPKVRVNKKQPDMD